VFHVKQFFTAIKEWLKIKWQWIWNWVFALSIDPPKLSGLIYLAIVTVLILIGAAGDRFLMSGSTQIINNLEKRVGQLIEANQTVEKELADANDRLAAMEVRAQAAEGKYAAASAAPPAAPVVKWRTGKCKAEDTNGFKLPF
jgi:hypothetical protein